MGWYLSELEKPVHILRYVRNHVTYIHGYPTLSMRIPNIQHTVVRMIRCYGIGCDRWLVYLSWEAITYTRYICNHATSAHRCQTLLLWQSKHGNSKYKWWFSLMLVRKVCAIFQACMVQRGPGIATASISWAQVQVYSSYRRVAAKGIEETIGIRLDVSPPVVL
jgi:hypothetical protein